MTTNSKTVMRAQRRKKQFAVDAFGGKCQICGYKRCLGALSFHHLSDKKHPPSYIILRWSWERAKKELDKCILVCNNCHAEIHEKNMSTELLVYKKPFLSKNCKQCSKKFDTKNYKQTFCSTSCQYMSYRKVHRPSKHELKKLIEKHNWVQLGKMFGVSDNAIRKWARNYELI